jgi:DNA invertase Pin-like site-specific DNA recombinase
MLIGYGRTSTLEQQAGIHAQERDLSAAEVVRLDSEGLRRTEIARRTGIGVASAYRVLAEAKRVAGDQKTAARLSDGISCSPPVSRRSLE